MSKTAVAEKKSTDLAAFDYGADAGTGFENQTREDITIPFLAITQALSPVVTKQTIDGAKPGLLYNTVGEHFYPDNQIRFVPGYTDHVYVEWVPRKEGGGFAGIHAIDSDVVKQAKAEATEFGKFTVPREGGGVNDLIETFYVYGVVVDENHQPEGMMVLSFTSSKIKVYKKWNTNLRSHMINVGDRKINPPIFANVALITTKEESNPEGDFFNYSITPSRGNMRDSLLEPGHPALEEAKGVAEMVKSGLARAAYESQEQAGDAAGSSGDGDKGDDDVPFG